MNTNVDPRTTRGANASKQDLRVWLAEMEAAGEVTRISAWFPADSDLPALREAFLAFLPFPPFRNLARQATTPARVRHDRNLGLARHAQVVGRALTGTTTQDAPGRQHPPKNNTASAPFHSVAGAGRLATIEKNG